jgi:hypothetical protein
MDKHTPEPWELDNSRRYYSRTVIRHNGVVVCEVSKPTAGLTAEEAAANGVLLAAAPALLAACRECADALNYGVNRAGAFAAAAIAIENATA